MIINQNVPAILRAFLNLQKKCYEKPFTKETSAAATTEFLGKVPHRKKYLMNTLIFVRQKYLYSLYMFHKIYKF